MGLDIQNIAEGGKECEEYRAIVEFIRSGEEVKKSPVNHPVRSMAAMQQVMGVEETAKGPVVMVEGTRIMIPRGARKQMTGPNLEQITSHQLQNPQPLQIV